MTEQPMEDKEKQELFDTITTHLLNDARPSEYIKALSQEKCCSKFPFTLLWELKATGQSEKYHPEGSVWNHTMLVLDEAAKVRAEAKEQKVFMWAALLHDIGKPGTTRMRKGRITSYDHDREGEKLSITFLEYFTKDREFIQRTASLVRYHMHMLYVLKKLPFADVPGMLQRTNPIDIALLCRCDRLGRMNADAKAEQNDYLQFIERLKSLQAADEKMGK